MSPIPVSVIVMTRNEAANLPWCLAALGRFGQVLVVDSASDDDTPAIAAAWGVPVVPFVWNGRYPKKKQWCLDQLALAYPWVLQLDADECLTPALVEEIAALMARPGGPPAAGYFIAGRPVFLGRPLRFGLHNHKLCLIDRRRARFPELADLDLPMGEVEGHYQPQLAGPAGHLRQVLLHHDRKPLAAWFQRHNRYSDWEAGLDHSGRRAAVIALEHGWRRRLKILFAALPARPLALFAYLYLLRLGCLDGRPGLHYALARAFYLWQVQVKRLERAGRDDGRPVPYPWLGGLARPSAKGPECRVAGRMDGEDRGEAAHVEDLLNVGLEAAQGELAAGRLDPLGRHQQHPQTGTADIVELAGVNHQGGGLGRDLAQELLLEALGGVAVESAAGIDHHHRADPRNNHVHAVRSLVQS